MCFRPASIEQEVRCPECGTKCGPQDTACPKCGYTVEQADSPYFIPGAGAPGMPAAPGAPGAPGAPAMPPMPKAPGQ